MTIKYRYKKMILKVAVIIGFAVVSIGGPVEVYADDHGYLSEEDAYDRQDLSQEAEKDILERQKNVMSELEKLKADTQVSRRSLVDTTTGPQSYFENDLTPEITNEATDGGETRKVYKYNKKTEMSAPSRLFNNVR